MRKGDWMMTATGGEFWPLDPRSDEVGIIDIAHGLAHICRFGGHTKFFYSVAEHSLLVSHALLPATAMYGLLHDAAEAYLGDVIRPLKRFIPGYKDMEEGVMVAICDHFGLHYPMPPQVKEVDCAILQDEYVQVMPRVPELNPLWEVGAEPLGVEIYGYGPKRAAEKFLERFVELGGELS